MARARLIWKSLSTSVKYIALGLDPDGLGEFCQVLYPLLVVHSDDHGRLQGDPSTVKFLVLPGSSRNLPEFHGALRKLREAGLVHWYTVDGKKYLQVIDFDAHQSGLHKRTPSKFPEFPGSSGNVQEIPSEEKRRDLSTEQDQSAAKIGQLNGKVIEELLLPSVAAGVSDETRAAAAEMLTTTKTKATNGTKNDAGRSSLLVAERLETPRKQKPVFFGSRFAVFDWQLRELEAMVGTDAFDVLGFLFELDSRHSQSGQVIPREGVWLWLQQQVLGEARRRGMAEMPMASDLSKASTRMMNSIARIEAEERAELLALEKGGDE